MLATKVFGVWRGWQRSEVRGVQGQVIKVNKVMDGRMSRKVQVPLRSADDGLLVMNRAGGNWRRFQERGRAGACVNPSEPP